MLVARQQATKAPAWILAPTSTAPAPRGMPSAAVPSDVAARRAVLEKEESLFRARQEWENQRAINKAKQDANNALIESMKIWGRPACANSVNGCR